MTEGIPVSQEASVGEEDVLTLKEVAAWLRISHSSVRNLILSGKLRAFQVGQGQRHIRRRIFRRDVLLYIQQQQGQKNQSLHASLPCDENLPSDSLVFKHIDPSLAASRQHNSQKRSKA